MKNEWMETATGLKFYPFAPEPDMFRLEDITTSLSQQCRFNGHTKKMYTVAQHSLHVGNIVPPELRVYGLLHDAAEAYLSDIPSPIKKYLAVYHDEKIKKIQIFEKSVLRALCEKFGLDIEKFESPELIDADIQCLIDEKNRFMTKLKWDWDVPQVTMNTIHKRCPLEAERAKYFFHDEILLALKI